MMTLRGPCVCATVQADWSYGGRYGCVLEKEGDVHLHEDNMTYNQVLAARLFAATYSIAVSLLSTFILFLSLTSINNISRTEEKEDFNEAVRTTHVALEAARRGSFNNKQEEANEQALSKFQRLRNNRASRKFGGASFKAAGARKGGMMMVRMAGLCSGCACI